MKKFSLFAIMILLLAFLAACQDQPEPTPTAEPAVEVESPPTAEAAEEPTAAPVEEPAEEPVEEPAEEAPAAEAPAAPVPPGLIGQQTERLRALDFSPFAEALAGFSEERAAAVAAIVTDATILDVQAALEAGDLTSEELTLWFLSRIQEYDEGLRTYTEINPNALNEARAADELRAAGTVLGPMHGIPVNLKDNIGTAAPMHTTGGAEILLDYAPAEDAPLVTQLREVGAVILGKANLSELAGGVALFPAGYTAVAGQTINPYGADFPTLGSSSGSAASTAAMLTMASVGSETGGSLIAPSALNGVVGMYPTDDLVSDEGVIPLVSSTDTPGPIGRSVTDAAVLLGAIDSADVDYTATLDVDALNGVTAGFFAADLSPDNAALNLSGFEDTSDQGEKVQLIEEILGAAGAEIVPAELLPIDELAPSDELIMSMFGPTLAQMGITDLSEVDDETRAAIEAAITVPGIVVAQYFNPLVAGGIAYDMVDYLIAAGAPITSLADFQAYNNEMPERRIPNGQWQIDDALPRIEAGLTREAYEQLSADAQPALAAELDAIFAATGAEILVSMVNEHSSYYALAGYPAITVPLGLRANGAPTGVTLIGKPGMDAQLLAYAYAFEQASMLRANPDLDSVMQQTDSGAAAAAASEVDSMAGLGDPLYPGLGNAGYDVQHYTIDLDVDMETGGIDGSATIDSLATEELSAFNFDFSGLDISEITVDGAPANFNREGTELIITPASPIAGGAAFTTAVTYSGVPEAIVDPGVPFTPVGWLQFPDEDTISVISEPSGAMSWFPNNNHPQDKATYTISVTVPQPYVVAANGELADITNNGDTTTYVWEMDDLMASYLATVNIGEFERDDTFGPDGILLRNYYPAGRIDEFAPAFEPTAEMIEFFSGILGPYPFDVYGAVVLPVEGDFALETQTLSVFPESAVSEETIAHELMHQWLGNNLSPETWQDIWLNEGFSAYFPFLWDEHVNGPEANLMPAMGAYYNFAAGAQLAPPAAVTIDNLFTEAVYVRGPLTLHALRTVVGDDVFFEIMRTYYERFAGGTASTQDFIDVAAELGGEEARELLNAWLYETEVPPFPGTE